MLAVRVEQLPFCLRIRWLELQVIFVSLIMSDCLCIYTTGVWQFSAVGNRIYNKDSRKNGQL